MFKKLIGYLDGIVSFWKKTYLYTFVLLLFSMPAISSYSKSLIYILGILLIVFIVFIVLEFKKSIKIIKSIIKFEKLIEKKFLKKNLTKLKWILIINCFLNIFPFNWIWAFFLKIYFYHFFKNIKIYLGIFDKDKNY